MNNMTNPASDNFKLILVASYGTAIGALIFNTQPAIVGALAESFSFTAAELGSIISMVLIAIFFMVVSSYYWIHRVLWRLAVSVGTATACLGAVGLVFADGFTTVTASLSLIGAGAAGVYVVCLSSLATSADPTRAFGVAITMQVAVAALVVYLIPSYVLPLYGISGVAVLLFLLLVLGFGVAPFLPERRQPDSSNKPRAPQGSDLKTLVILGLGAMTVYFVGLNGTWAFLERIGDTLSLTGEVIGRALGVSLVFGAIGSLMASVIGRRFNVSSVLWLTGGGFLVFVYLMLEVSGVVAFTVALVIFNAVWNFSLPYQMDLISQADTHGRYIVLVPAAQTIGGAIGPAIAGPILVSNGVPGVYLQMVICIGAAYLLYGLVAKRLQHKSTE